MSKENWSRIKQIVDEAIHREPHERAAFLKSACGDNESIRREVESLLSSFESADDFMEAPALAAVTERIPELEPAREPPSEPRESPETALEGAEGVDDHPYRQGAGPGGLGRRARGYNLHGKLCCRSPAGAAECQ